MGNPQGGVDLAIWQKRKIELWSCWQVENADRQSENPAMSPRNFAKCGVHKQQKATWQNREVGMWT